MNKINKCLYIIKNNKWIHYCVIIIIGLILSIPFSNVKMANTHDGVLHLLRLIGTVDTLKIGQIPPLINQNYCNCAGYAMNLFYAPLVTYVPLIIRLFTNSYTSALRIFGSICVILSGITMYKFTYTITKNRIISIFSAIFYMVAPYKIASFYRRYAIGEFTASVFIPLVFLGLYNLLKQDGKKHYYISIGAIGLVLSHTISAYYIAIFCLIYVLINIKKLKQIEILKKLVINCIFIILISVFFYVPLLEATSAAEYSITDDEIMGTTAMDAQTNAISPSELIFLNKEREKGWEVIAKIGIPTLIILLTTLFIGKNVDEKYKNFYFLFFVFSILSIYMATKFFPWKIMPNFLCKLQFPWRMLGFTAMFNSFICGINIYWILKKVLKRDFLRLLVIVIFTIILIIESIYYVSMCFYEEGKSDFTVENEILSNPIRSHRAINKEYMPKKAFLEFRTYVPNRKNITYVLEGNAKVAEEQKENLKDIIRIENGKVGDVLEFPYYYYVGYEITLSNGEKTKPIESEHGYLAYKLDRDLENETIIVEYKGTIIQKVSYSISLISMICFVVYLIYEIRKNGERDV